MFLKVAICLIVISLAMVDVDARINCYRVLVDITSGSRWSSKLIMNVINENGTELEQIPLNFRDQEFETGMAEFLIATNLEIGQFSTLKITWSVYDDPMDIPPRPNLPGLRNVQIDSVLVEPMYILNLISRKNAIKKFCPNPRPATIRANRSEQFLTANCNN